MDWWFYVKCRVSESLKKTLQTETFGYFQIIIFLLSQQEKYILFSAAALQFSCSQMRWKGIFSSYSMKSWRFYRCNDLFFWNWIVQDVDMTPH